MGVTDGPAAYWAVIPAAGSGRRMTGDTPKQYRMLRGRRLIEHSIGPLLDQPGIRRIVVVLAEGDQLWSRLPMARDGRVAVAPGGEERWQSVLSGLRALEGEAGKHDPVLVHDAARPCLARSDLEALMSDPDALQHGGLLGARVADTLKRGDDQDRVVETIDRTPLWRALTPQMFSYGMLRDALERVERDADTVTDDAAAVERNGGRPRLVPGRTDNLKVTREEDLELAAFILARRAGSVEVP